MDKLVRGGGRVLLNELPGRIRYWRSADRLGPDIPWTHWRLHFKGTMLALCQAKFRRFADSAEFRPGAYSVTCSKIEIGERVVIRPGTMLFADPRPDGAGIIIEDGVMIGSGVHVYVADHRFDDPNLPIIDQGHSPSQPVILRRGCWIGAQSVILAGVEIGANSVIGAGSIVTRSTQAGVLTAGNPARVIRQIGA